MKLNWLRLPKKIDLGIKGQPNVYVSVFIFVVWKTITFVSTRECNKLINCIVKHDAIHSQFYCLK